jgi:hypothetical protein
MFLINIYLKLEDSVWLEAELSAALHREAVQSTTQALAEFEQAASHSLSHSSMFYSSPPPLHLQKNLPIFHLRETFLISIFSRDLALAIVQQHHGQ